MIRTALALAIAAFLALPAAAQDDVSMIEGLWSGSGEGELTVDLSHIDGEIYGISIETLVPIENDMPGCAGGIDGEVILTKRAAISSSRIPTMTRIHRARSTRRSVKSAWPSTVKAA